MCGQLYRGHANATALPSSPVVSVLGSESDDPGSTPGRGRALCPWDVREKKIELRFEAWLNLYIKSDSRFAVVQLLITSATTDWIEHHSVLSPLPIIKDRVRAREKWMHVNIHYWKFTCNRVQLPQQQQTENDHFYHPRHDQVCVCIHNNSWVEYLACHQCKMSNQRGNPCDAVRWR